MSTKRLPPETQRLEGESPQAFEAFAAYRDQGLARSTAHVSRELGKSKALMDRWSSKHKWVRRCSTYDREVDRRKQLGDLRAVEEMRHRQVKNALMLQELGALAIAAKLKSAKKKRGADHVEEAVAVKMIDQGSKLERLNLGEPGEITQQSAGDGLDLSGLSTDELKLLRVLRSKVRARQLAEMKGDDDDD